MIDIAAARALAAGPTYGLTERGAATITALCDEVERLRVDRDDLALALEMLAEGQRQFLLNTMAAMARKDISR